MKKSLGELLQNIPGTMSEKWPQGERFAHVLSHGTMTVELYAPIGHDPQTPHDQDELYFVAGGSSEFLLKDERMQVTSGDVIFVPAGAVHRFENFSDDFMTWVVFWGAHGGEK